MEITAQKNNIKGEFLSGLIACGYIIPLSAAFASVTGQGLWAVLLCCAACALFSIKNKNGILIPDIRFIALLLCFSYNIPQINLYISVISGGLLFCLAKKLNIRQTHTHEALTAISLCLAISSTVLLTNTYFGIGAFGGSTVEMLKAYRYLGFHPNFMGLLTGTITLFTMITYPFKFKKLSKYISPHFITLAIPFILNLFLNPDSTLTNIDEAAFLTFNNTPSVSFELSDILETLAYSILIGEFLHFYNSNESYSLGVSHIFSPFPLRREEINNYGVISAFIVLLITSATAIFIPEIYTRLPLHSIGAMLIVYAWQNVPYKYFKEVFKHKKRTIFVLISVILFFIFDSFFVILALMSSAGIKEREDKNNG